MPTICLEQDEIERDPRRSGGEEKEGLLLGDGSLLKEITELEESGEANTADDAGVGSTREFVEG